MNKLRRVREKSQSPTAREAMHTASSAVPRTIHQMSAAQKVWATEARLARARAVRNAIATAEGTLRMPETPDALRTRAEQTIDAAWGALAGRNVGTEEKLRLLEAVDVAAAASEPAGRAAGEIVLAQLPPELLMAFAPHVETLGGLVDAWRRREPGRGRAPGKWKACAALWNDVHGGTTTADAWEAMWKGAASARKVRVP